MNPAGNDLIFDAELCEYIGDGIRKLRDGPVWQYIPDFNWNTVRDGMGPSKLYDHLVDADAAQGADDTQDSDMPSVAQAVCRVLDIQPDDLNVDVPLTSYGLDSLTAASLSYALRPFLHISQIQLLADITTGGIQSKINDAKTDSAGNGGARSVAEEPPCDRSADIASRTREMEALVEDLRAGLLPISHEPEDSLPKPSQGLVLVTGTTGSLGAHVLAQLCGAEGESRIVALLRRRSGSSPLERQIAAFASRGLDVASLQSERLRVVDGNLDEPGLGLSQELYEEVGIPSARVRSGDRN